MDSLGILDPGDPRDIMDSVDSLWFLDSGVPVDIVDSIEHVCCFNLPPKGSLHLANHENTG